MNERLFRARVREESEGFAQDLDKLEQGGQVDAVQFAARYRLLCQRLALARQRQYGADLVSWLNELAMRGHAQLYRRTSVHWLRDAVDALTVQFPRALRAQWKSQLAALLLFVVPALGAWLTIRYSPELVYHFIGVEQVRNMEAMYDPASDHFLRERASGDDVQMFGFYIFNNIGIAFRTFASGLLFGVGSAFLIAYNGVVLGAVAGHLQVVGSGQTFFPFVIGHGALELPAIVIAGGTGLALGFALLAPGAYGRIEALQRAARRSVPVIYGFTAMLLGAAFLEAFWSSQHTLGNAVRYGVGGLLWAGMTAFVLFSGRRVAA
jgi:uncharacterized membrane protein SpoIIM required for sporulation